MKKKTLYTFIMVLICLFSFLLKDVTVIVASDSVSENYIEINLLEDSTYDYAFVCGPEIMMKGIFDILEDAKIPAQYSLERYMKCALGVCGQCCVDSEGWRICVEGPVFENEKIYKIDEFAKYRRDASGVKY